MSDFRTSRLVYTEECSLSDNTIITSTRENKTYSQSLSSVITGGQIRNGMLRTGYVTMMDNPKCYPLSLDDEGRGYAKITWTDTVISSMVYDKDNKRLVIKMSNPDVDTIYIPVNDLVNKYYPDNSTISARNNVFGVKDGTLIPNGDYISASSSSDDEDYMLMRMIDDRPKQRNVVNKSVNCVETSGDYKISKESSILTILDYRDKDNPMIEYGNNRIPLSSYDQLQNTEYGLDVRVGEMLYNKNTYKLWYLRNTDVSSMIQLDENIIRVVVSSDNQNMGTTEGSGIYDQGTDVSIYAIPKTGYKFVKWNDGNTDKNRIVHLDDSKKFTATFKEDITVTYYDNI